MNSRDETMAVTMYLERGLEMYAVLHPGTTPTHLMIGVTDLLLIKILELPSKAARDDILEATLEYLRSSTARIEADGLQAAHDKETAP